MNDDNVFFPTQINGTNIKMLVGGGTGVGFDAGMTVVGGNNALAPSLVRQMRDLRNAYTAIANVYRDKPVFSAVAGAEGGMKDDAYTGITDWKTFSDRMEGYVDTVWDAIFGDDTTARTDFDADLAAYKKGNYISQKQRFSDDPLIGSSAVTNGGTSLATLNSEFTSLITAIGDWGDGATPEVNSSDGKISNLQTILAQLQTRLEGKINTAMGVDELTESSVGYNQYIIKQQVTPSLLIQLGQDFQQWQAFVDDIADVGYDIYFVNGKTLSERVADGGSMSPIAMGTPKASHIDGFNFDMDLLRTNKAIDGKDGIALA